MKVVIHQPQFLPYPGFFHKLSLADTLVVMDDVQYDKRFTNRNRILAPQGAIWLTVPINKSHKFSINSEVEVNNAIPWRQEHLKRIRYSYGNAKYFDNYAPFLEDVYSRDHERLMELDLEITRKMMEWLGLNTKVVYESELHVEGKGTERLVNASAAVGADTYVSGKGGRSYVDESLFAARGINLEFQDYVPRPYPQRFVRRFVPDLSALDMLFNAGPESRRLVLSDRGGEGPVTSSQANPIEEFLAIDNIPDAQ